MSNLSNRVKKYFTNLKIMPFIFAVIMLAFIPFGIISSNLKPKKEINLDYNYSYEDENVESLSYSMQNQQNTLLSNKNQIEYEALLNSDLYNSIDQSSIPTEYSLYKLNSLFLNNFSLQNANNYENLNYNVGNQSGAGICWSFATLSALESTIYKSGLVNSSDKLNFSELHLAYSALVQNRNENFSTVGGGIFELALEYLAANGGPVNEQENENYSKDNANNSFWDSDVLVTDYYKTNYLSSAEFAGFNVLESFSYPSRTKINNLSSLTESEKLERKNNLRLSIKNHIKTYGAVTASIYYHKSYLLENYTVYYNDSVTTTNHMVTLVGWDDDFIYRETINGEIVEHKGAYIAQNSHGTDFGVKGFCYILYDDLTIEDNINGFVRVGKTLDNSISYNNMSGLKYENELMTYFDDEHGKGFSFGNGLSYVQPIIFANIYKITDVDNQFISRIKVPTYVTSEGSKFELYIQDNLTEDDVSTNSLINKTLKSNFSNAKKVKDSNNNTVFSSNQTGYYTVELSKDSYSNLKGDFFVVYMSVEERFSFVFFDNKEGSESFQPYNYTYLSANVEGYTLSFTQETDFIMPMIVQTQYELGDIEYSVENVTSTYDGNNKTINIDVVTPNTNVYYRLTEQDAWSITHPVCKNAGDYTIYFKIEANSFNTVLGSAKISITKKDLIVTPRSSQSCLYGENIPTIGYKLSGNVLGETPAFSGRIFVNVNTDCPNVGEYAYDSTFELKDNGNFKASNYNLIFKTVDDNSNNIYFEITPRQLYVTPLKSTKTYGEDDSEIKYTYSNNFNSEEPVFLGSLNRIVGENVGLYNAVNNLTLEDNLSTGFLKDNYKIVLINYQNVFEITKRDLIITPKKDYEKIYTQQQDPTFEYSYSNVVGNEIPSFIGSLSRELGLDVGKYAITLGTLTAVDNGDFLADNYVLKLSDKTAYLSISYGEITGCSVENIVVTYNGYEHKVNPVCDIDDVQLFFSLDNNSWQSEEISFKDVGTYQVYTKFSKKNFVDVVVSSNVTIYTASLTIIPESNQSYVYGENYNILYTYSKNVSNETPSFAGNLVAKNKNVGTTTITRDNNFTVQNNGNFKVSNYTINFIENVSIQITQRTLIIEPTANQHRMYDGTNNTPNLTFKFQNLARDEVACYDGYLSRVAGSNAGEYEFDISNIELKDSLDNLFKASNYILQLDNTNKFIIDKANITITVDNKSSLYTDPVVNEFTCQISGDYVSDDNLNIEYNCIVNEQTKKGDYDITASAHNDNYNITIINAIYSVRYKFFTVSFVVLDEVIAEVLVEHFSKIDKTKIPQAYITGYNFNAWKEGYAVVNWDERIFEQDAVITADFTLTEYFVQYNTNGGIISELATKVFYCTTPTFNLLQPTKEGHVFKGWYTASDFSGQQITQVLMGTSNNVILYAKWQINTYTATIPSLVGGRVVLKQQNNIEYNNSLVFDVELDYAYNKSYTNLQVFVCWLNNGEVAQVEKNIEGLFEVKNVKDNFDIVVENIKLNKYIITFLADNNLVNNIEVEHGKDLLSKDMPKIPMENKQNYNQQAPYWEISNLNNITNDQIINAVYIPNVYDVIFKMEDGKEFKTSVTYGENVSYDFLKESYDLNMFEYFEFDSSIKDISQNTIINVQIKSNIYILYIVLAILGGIIVLVSTVVIIKKVKRRKFDWWNYAKPPKGKL